MCLLPGNRLQVMLLSHDDILYYCRSSYVGVGVEYCGRCQLTTGAVRTTRTSLLDRHVPLRVRQLFASFF